MVVLACHHPAAVPLLDALIASVSHSWPDARKIIDDADDEPRTIALPKCVAALELSGPLGVGLDDVDLRMIRLYQDGKTHKEMAAELGYKPAGIASRLTKIRKIDKSLIEPRRPDLFERMQGQNRHTA